MFDWKYGQYRYQKYAQYNKCGRYITVAYINAPFKREDWMEV